MELGRPLRWHVIALADRHQHSASATNLGGQRGLVAWPLQHLADGFSGLVSLVEDRRVRWTWLSQFSRLCPTSANDPGQQRHHPLHFGQEEPSADSLWLELAQAFGIAKRQMHGWRLKICRRCPSAYRLAAGTIGVFFEASLGCRAM